MHLATMVGKQDVREWYPSTTGPLFPTMTVSGYLVFMDVLRKGQEEGGMKQENWWNFFTFFKKKGGGTKSYTKIYNLLAIGQKALGQCLFMGCSEGAGR
mmetsp:Transcript_65503/g.109056  ORF Transcript_65503/g.109056 Transcript_65503/m.109056 type:complete len:99 (-) Transcript_65503:53-349(-)